MREKHQALRACPTCGTPAHDIPNLGLRGYEWVNQSLPGKVGAADLDFVLHNRDCTRLLVIEFKPHGVGVPRGQELTLGLLVQAGHDVWIVWGDGLDEYALDVGVANEDGHVEDMPDSMTVADLADRILDWYLS